MHSIQPPQAITEGSLGLSVSHANRALADGINALRKQLWAASSVLLDNRDTISVLAQHVGKTQRDVYLASHKLTQLSQEFSSDEHVHQMELRNLVSSI